MKNIFFKITSTLVFFLLASCGNEANKNINTSKYDAYNIVAKTGNHIDNDGGEYFKNILKNTKGKYITFNNVLSKIKIGDLLIFKDIDAIPHAYKLTIKYTKNDIIFYRGTTENNYNFSMSRTKSGSFTGDFTTDTESFSFITQKNNESIYGIVYKNTLPASLSNDFFQRPN